MGRLLIFVLLGCVVVRMTTGRWPWTWLAASGRSQAEADARSILGVSRNATRDEITDAHRRLLVRVHPDRGGSAEAVYQANHARDLLLVRADRSRSETP